MKRLTPVLLAAVAAVSLSACMTTYGDHHDRMYRLGYYDDAYGPYHDGYWGADGVFMYSTTDGGPYVRDDAHHFRRDANAGYHSFEGRHHDDMGH